MGVHELGLRRAILAEIDKYKERQEEIRLATKLRKLGESKVRYIVHSLTQLPGLSLGRVIASVNLTSVNLVRSISQVHPIITSNVMPALCTR